MADQVGTLAEIAVEEGSAVVYVKPHGALYHRVRDDAEQAAAVLAGSGHLPVLGQPGAFLDLAIGAGRATYRRVSRTGPTAATGWCRATSPAR